MVPSVVGQQSPNKSSTAQPLLAAHAAVRAAPCPPGAPREGAPALAPSSRLGLGGGAGGAASSLQQPSSIPSAVGQQSPAGQSFGGDRQVIGSSQANWAHEGLIRAHLGP